MTQELLINVCSEMNWLKFKMCKATMAKIRDPDKVVVK
jgi:hypothetical protein